MSNELTNKTMVLVTGIGPVWVTRERGEAAMQIKEADPNSVIEIDGSHYAAYQIKGLLNAKQYNDYQMERRGYWQCQYERWHARNDNCMCGRDLANKKPNPPPKEMTEEEREKALLKLREIRKNFANRRKVT